MSTYQQSPPRTTPLGYQNTSNSTLSADNSTNIPFPQTRNELELLILRYRSLHLTKANPIEEEKIERVLYQISKQQESYKLRLNSLRKSRKKRDYDQAILRDQLIAFQLISKGISVPDEIKHSLALTDAYSNGDDTSIKQSDDLSRIESVSDFHERLSNLGIHDKFSSKYALDTIAEQETRKKINTRINELEKIPANIGTFKFDDLSLDAPDDLYKNADELKIRALVELKGLKLLSKQKDIRQKLLFSVGSKAHTTVDILKSHPITLTAQRSLQIRSKVITKQTAKLAEELEQQQRLEKQRIELILHKKKIRAIVDKTNDIRDERDDLLSKRYQFAKSISQLHIQIEKDEGKKLEKTARQRLQALKANDEEAYLKLLDQTKDTRITHLLKQTNSFLDSLARAVQTQQTEAKLANGEEIIEEFTDEQREKIDYYEVAHKVKEEITTQPSILIGGNLKEYQLRGLEWMVSLYNNHLNGILADEMGLGKTIQSLSLITYLIEVKKEKGPFLVIVPLSTITNWTLEFEKWAPSLKIIIYKGSPNQRKNLAAEVKTGNFNVLLTTFEYIIKDRPILSKLKWAHMIIDEGHRMKNAQSKLAITISQYYHTKNRLILTGTPLQNNLPELWALLNFVLPKVFNSVKTFDEWFNTPFANTGGQEKIELSEEETLLVIRRLHKVLRPFLLRRLKKEVEKDLPDKVETVIKCKLSGLQYALYQQMLKHNALFLGAGTSGTTKSGLKGLNNKIMQLRKICNHPYVFEEVENVINPLRTSTEMLWRTSGKFELLDRVLPKFKRSGHRVLMFFQMTQVMDIMEDYLRMKDLKYLRLDGSTKADDRTDMLKEFNHPESEYFCFLLSTRAGGLGLNLQTADTVVIFDTDWNPHQDLQAQDRAHRIGQKNEVRILRLITTDTVEEVILERALQKLDIDGKVIQAGKFDNKSTAEEQEAFLKKLLENDGRRNNDEKEELDDDELNDVLARSDQERELFSQMDLERITHEKIQSRKPGFYKDRLITESELPEIFTEDISKHLEPEAHEELGRTRDKKRVYYDDGLTEEQWLLAMDDDEDSVEAAIERKRSARDRRTKRQSDGSSTPKPNGNVAVTNGRAKRSRSVALEEDDQSQDEEEEEQEFDQEQDNIVDVDDEYQSEGNTFITAKKPKKQQTPLVEQGLKLLDELQEATSEEDGHLLSEYFIELPSRKLYPDYYKIIPKPIALNTIRKNLKSGKVKLFEKFKDDVLRIYSNAKFYNEEGSGVYDDAVTLENLANSRLDKFELE